MLTNVFQLTLIIVLNLTVSALSAIPARTDDLTVFNPPAVKPILHLVPVIDYPINSSDIYTANARIANLGGKATSRPSWRYSG